MNLEIGSQTVQQSTFELVLNVRDREGKPTGTTKSFKTEDASKLHQFWFRNSPSKKKKKNKTQAAKSTTEINQGLQEAEEHTKKIRKKRKLED